MSLTTPEMCFSMSGAVNKNSRRLRRLSSVLGKPIPVSCSEILLSKDISLPFDRWPRKLSTYSLASCAGAFISGENPFSWRGNFSNSCQQFCCMSHFLRVRNINEHEKATQVQPKFKQTAVRSFGHADLPNDTIQQSNKHIELLAAAYQRQCIRWSARLVLLSSVSYRSG